MQDVSTLTLLCHRPTLSLASASYTSSYFFFFCVLFFFRFFALCFYSYHFLLAMRDVPPVSFLQLFHLYFNEKSLLVSYSFSLSHSLYNRASRYKKTPYIFLSLSDLPSSLSSINTTIPQVLASPFHHTYLPPFPPHPLCTISYSLSLAHSPSLLPSPTLCVSFAQHLLLADNF